MNTRSKPGLLAIKRLLECLVGDANRATLAVARKLVAYLVAKTEHRVSQIEQTAMC